MRGFRFPALLKLPTPLAILAGLGLATCAVSHAAQSDGRWLAGFFGATHSGGKYSLPTRAEPLDYLNEGADRIEEMGAGVLKLWLNDQPSRNYPHFSSAPETRWPAVGSGTPYTSMAKLAAHPFYRAAISRPAFTTVSLVVTEFARVTWRDGLSATEAATVTAEMRELTEYLLTTYAADGKTFILQNWEGDNLLNLDQFPDTSTWRGMADGMIAYFKARQLGVEQGRAAVGAASTSQVWHALEINYNWAAARSGTISIPEEWTLLNCVVRDGYATQGLQCDLYSWSQWSAKSPGDEPRVIRGIDYMRARIPTGGPFGDRAMFLGEFGAIERSYYDAGATVHSASSDAIHADVSLNQFSFAWRCGLQRAIYWQIYDNGMRDGLTFDYANPVSKTEQEVSTTWLIRAPGPPTYPEFSYTTAHHRFASLMDCWLLEDDLTDFSLVHAQTGWTASTTPQSWAPGTAARLYRATEGPAELVYRTEGDLVDFHVTAYLYAGIVSSGRVRGYTSADGVTWSEPFAFKVLNSVAVDPATPDWVRQFLGPAATVPAGTRYLKIEMHDTGAIWRTQLGAVKIISRGLPPAIATAPAPQLARTGASVTLTTAAIGRGPLRYRWYRGDTFVRETRTPALTLDAVTAADAGAYRVEVGNSAGFTASADARVLVGASHFAAWQTGEFDAAQLAQPVISGPAADPNGDGLPNLLAFALARPALASSGPAPLETAPVTDSGSTYLSLTFTRRAELDDVALVTEFADSPAGPWIAGGITLASVADGDRLRVTVRDTVPLETQPRRFARLRAAR